MKRIIGILLTCALCLTLLPAAAFAAEDQGWPGGHELPQPPAWRVAARAAGETPRGDNDVAYAVSGGKLWFDPSTGTVTGCDETVTYATVPSRIGGVNVTAIGDFAFWNCGAMTGVTIPSGVTKIGDMAFADCARLTAVGIPGTVKSIGTGAFYNCAGIAKLTIPEGLTSIEKYAFDGCTSLLTVTVVSANNTYSTKNGVLLNKAGTRLIVCPAGKVGAYTVPSTVTEIGPDAFWGCANLTSVTIPSSVKTIGDDAISGCASLTAVKLPSGVTALGQRTFSACTSLRTVTIPAGVTVIGKNAFYNTALQDVYFLGTQAKWNAVKGLNSAGIPAAAKIHNSSDKAPSGTVTITAQPAGQTVEKGSKVTYTVKASGDGLTYQWWYKNGTGTGFVKSTCKTASWSFTAVAGTDMRSLYCEVTSSAGESVQSKVVTNELVRPPLKILTQPESVTAAKGERASFAVEAEGYKLSYQWYYKNPGADAFTKSTGRSSVYGFTALAATNGRQIYCVVTDGKGKTAQTDTVTLTVGNPLAITAQPKSQTVTKGAKATFTVKASGDGLTYQWYYKNASASSYTKAACTQASYAFTAVAATDGRQLYCIVKDGAGQTVRSSTVKLTLK